MVIMLLSTKAKTLKNLTLLLTKAKILPIQYFTVEEWHKNTDQILSNFSDKESYIVRSSALNENTSKKSMAGYYESILNVKGYKNLKEAIEKVIQSYDKKQNPKDEILIQPMLKNVTLSGVAFSVDPATGAPYKVINYDISSDTTSITSGMKNAKTFVVAKTPKNISPEMKKILNLIEELQKLCKIDHLDIEFSFSKKDLYLLQVRPLIIDKKTLSQEKHHKILNRIAKKVKQSQKPHPFLHGKSTVFGVMPDWNPAEIIGIRPRPLALSLYRELVTDSVWSHQRDNYGYRNLKGFPLLVHFAGQPFIDVRVSFNSFIPKDIDDELADRLVNYYINNLVKTPSLHDKVEFEIIFSCYTFDLPERLKRLDNAGFTNKDKKKIEDALRHLTNQITHKDTGLWKIDENKIQTLSERREKLFASSMNIVEKIYWLLEDCKRYGTLPFAGLARAGFISVQMLKSFVNTGIFTQDDYDNFMNGLNTVSSQLSKDFCELNQTNFLNRYGHLRPGTYDILSPRYDESPEQYFGRECTYDFKDKKSFSLTLEQMRALQKLVKEHGLSIDIMDLFEFLQTGIELREFSKFEFTKNLSAAMSLFKQYGAQLGFSNEDLSFADIKCMREIYTGTIDPQEAIKISIQTGKTMYEETCKVWLPPLITTPDDIWAFHMPESSPNFITQKNIVAKVVKHTNIDQLDGAIVCIPSADPGFDWLFSHNIAGLITAYGGINSHMAIRANELGLPSIIGAGETLFKQWSTAKSLHIDCASRLVEIL